MDTNQEKPKAEERIKIEDLPVMEDMTPQEQKGILGGDGLPEDPFDQLN